MQNLSDDTTPQLGGDLDVNGNTITGLPSTPSSNTEAASKAYVDNTVGNIDAAFIETDQTLSTTKEIAANTNAACVGPIAIAQGVDLIIRQNSKLVVLN